MTNLDRALLAAKSARSLRYQAAKLLRMAAALEAHTFIKPVRTVTVRRVWIARTTVVIYGRTIVRKGHYRTYP